MLSLLDACIDTSDYTSPRNRTSEPARTAPQIISVNNAYTDGCHALDNTSGSVALFTVGSPAWHQLGKVISHAANYVEAMQFGGIDFTFQKQPLYLGNGKQSRYSWSIVRTDTGDELATVGPDFEPTQIVDVMKIIDSVLGEFGAHYHTAGALDGGRTFFVQAAIPSHTFEVVRGDEVKHYMTCVNPNDGTGRGRLFSTGTRTVCRNTVNAALEDAKTNGQSWRHSGDMKQKLRDARAALVQGNKDFEHFREKCEILARTPCNDPVSYFNATLDEVCDLTAAEAKMSTDALMASLAVTSAEWDAKRKQIDRQKKDRAATLSHILELYHSPTCSNPLIAGTAWKALNAVTEHSNHYEPSVKRGTVQDRAENRFAATMTGAGNELNTIAMNNALALAN